MSDSWIEPRRTHPLEGNIGRYAAWQIRETLKMTRPTLDQLDALAIEELAGKARDDVFGILDVFRSTGAA